MLKNKSVFLGAVYSFIAAVISSFVFSPVFEKLYLFIFKPASTGGLAGLDNLAELGFIQNSIFAFLFFLPLFIILLVPRKQWLVWLILIFIPFTIVLVNGSRSSLWFVIFTLIGVLIGWLVKLAARKLKK